MMIKPMNFTSDIKINGSYKTVCEVCKAVVYPPIKGINTQKELKDNFFKEIKIKGKTRNFCSLEHLKKWLLEGKGE